MQIDQLTQNGIERLLKGETVAVQIIGVTIVPLEKKGQNLQIIKAIISDGFAYYQSVYIHSQYFPNNNVNFNVIKIKLSEGQFKKIQRGTHKQDSPLVTETSSLIVVTNSIKKKIGNPISYDEFVKKGRKNPKGYRKLYENPKQDEDQYDTEDDLFNEVQKLKQISQRQKSNSKQATNKNQNTNNKIQNTNSNTNTNNKNALVKKQQESGTSRQNSVSNAHNNSKSVQPQKKTNQANKPIVKIQKPQKVQPRRNSIKPQVKHHDEQHQKINELFLGIESFKLLARLLFIMPIKSFTNKKGVQSQLLNMEFGDETGTIQCTVFGQLAGRYSTLQVDKIYSISGATITQSQYQGHSQKKLNFNDGTNVKLVQETKNIAIPTVDKFCLSLKQLNETEKGKVVSVKCLIKQGDLVQFVSKKGNNMKKKILKMYDLENQIQSQMTVFNDNAEMEYIDGMYALKGVEVDEFQGNKQFKSSFSFYPRFLKAHAMNKRIKEVEQLTFTSIASNQKPKRESINSFVELNEKSQNLELGQNLWTEVICYLKSVRSGGKNVYLSCPHCRKKITDENATQCQHCKKDFERPIYRYLLQINLMDDHDNIWASAYDEGEKILNTVHEQKFSADSYATMSDDMMKQRIQQIRYKQMKIKIVSAKEEFNGEVRLKHKIVKVLPIDFAQQSKVLLERIKAITSSL